MENVILLLIVVFSVIAFAVTAVDRRIRFLGESADMFYGMKRFSEVEERQMAEGKQDKFTA